MGHSFHTQTHMHRADLAAQLGYGAPPSFWDDEEMFAGAPPACGPSEYWDEAHQACVPLALPMPSTTSPVQCPPGQFFDYFKQACVAAAPPPHAAGALADVTIGPHLVSPLGWPYAWGQAAGLWGGHDAPSAPDPRRDDRYPGDRGGGTGNPDWATVALVGIGVVGVLGLGYLLVRR